ncbi:hypothetical protein HN011_010863 [Eciton burchellii]|jgi:hypothetical protein|nr:hypothetical protein HN011_010863 [Eciton burchellii]
MKFWQLRTCKRKGYVSLNIEYIMLQSLWTDIESISIWLMIADINTVSNTDVLGNLNFRADDWGNISASWNANYPKRRAVRSQLNYRTTRGRSCGRSSSREFWRAESRMKETS